MAPVPAGPTPSRPRVRRVFRTARMRNTTATSQMAAVIGDQTGRGDLGTRGLRFRRAALESPCPPVPMSLLVSERFDRVEARSLERGIHPEEDSDRRRESESDRERPPRQRDGEARRRMNGVADGCPEGDAD